MEKVKPQDLKVDDIVLVIRIGDFITAPKNSWVITLGGPFRNLWPFRVGIVQEAAFEPLSPGTEYIKPDGTRVEIPMKPMGRKSVLVYDKWFYDLQKKQIKKLGQKAYKYQFSAFCNFDWDDENIIIYRIGRWARDKDSPSLLSKSKGHIELT